MKVLISAGGTGGHLYPALALADYITKENKDNEVLFVGSSYRIEATKVQEYGYNFIGLNIKTPTGSIFNKIKGYSQVFYNVKRCEEIIDEFKPDAVIGFGGYTSYSAIKAATNKHIPTFLHEQNSVVGKSNKMLAGKVDYFISAYPNIAQQTNTSNVVMLGNPTSYHVMSQPKGDLSEYGLNPDLPTVLVVMGSQGSQTIDNMMKLFLEKAKNKNYQLIYVSGQDYYDYYKDKDYSPRIKVLPYIDGLVKVIKASDVIVSRAGASALTEILSAHKPAIFIPSIHVTNNHQYHNAKSVVDQDAALMVEENDDMLEKLEENIDLLIDGEHKYNAIVENTYKFELENSAKNIYELIEKKVEGKNER